MGVSKLLNAILLCMCVCFICVLTVSVFMQDPAFIRTHCLLDVLWYTSAVYVYSFAGKPSMLPPASNTVHCFVVVVCKLYSVCQHVSYGKG